MEIHHPTFATLTMAPPMPAPHAPHHQTLTFDGLSVTVELLTPELAIDYLDKNHENNRRPGDRTIRKYAKLMGLGQWMLTHQGLAFDVHGRLVDGQNRCLAVIASEKPIYVFVFRGLPLKALQVIDNHRARSKIARMTIGGHNMSNAQIAAVGRIVQGGKSTRNDLTDNETASVFELYREGVTFACDNTRKGHRTNGKEIHAAIARAYYHVDRDLLLDFCRIISHTPGVVSSNDISAASLLMSFAQKGQSGPSFPWKATLYRKTENAIRKYVDNFATQVLLPAKTELFPLPIDEQSDIGIK